MKPVPTSTVLPSLWKAAEGWSELGPRVDGKLAARGDAGSWLGRSCRSTTLSTVVEVAMNPANQFGNLTDSEFRNLANRTSLWKWKKRVGGKRTLAQGSSCRCGHFHS